MKSWLHLLAGITLFFIGSILNIISWVFVFITEAFRIIQRAIRWFSDRAFDYCEVEYAKLNQLDEEPEN